MRFHKFPPVPALQPYIEDLLLQEDLNPVNYANRNPVKVLPTAMPVMGIQYGQPMRRLEDGKAVTMGTSGLTGMQSTVREYVATGAIGTIIVRFKPGGLSVFTPYPLHEFRDANVPLELLFAPDRVREMEGRLAGATVAGERVAVVQRFLASLLREPGDERFIALAARSILQRHGAVSIERLAAVSFMSRRTLERKFNALIGAPPKQFAGIARFQHAMRLRNAGSGYLDIVEACGYADHAHFAKDFKAFAGCSPETFYRSEFQPELKKTFNANEPASPRTPQQMYF